MINFSGDIRLFKNDKGFYSIGISRKMEDGKYKSKYMNATIKGKPDIPNQTDIIVKNGFLSWDEYTKKGETEPTTVWKFIILDYELKNASVNVDDIDTTGFEITAEEDLPF